jgi:hypothetical protein
MDGKLVVTFKPSPHFEPYVAAVLAKRAAAESGSNPVSASERKTGLLRTNPPARLARTERDSLILRRAA